MSCKYPNINALMREGEPVCIGFEQKNGKVYDLLYCEMVHKARFGDSFCVSVQKCNPGNYVLGFTNESPAEYYLRSNRYKDADIAAKAAANLPRLEKQFSSIKIEPLSFSNNKFDVLIVYLIPEKAMRIIQSLAYSTGESISINTLGAGSICGDVTVTPLSKGIGLSFGCKGSRKHSGYSNIEIPLGINFLNLEKIEDGLNKIPNILD